MYFIVCDEFVCFVNIYVYLIDVLFEWLLILDLDLLCYVLISKVMEVIDLIFCIVLC